MSGYKIHCKNRNSYIRAGIIAMILAFLLLKIMALGIKEMGKDLLAFTSQDLSALVGVASFDLFLWVLGFVLVHAGLVLTERIITPQD